MRITAVRASWLRAPIPPAAAHVSDFGRNDSFNMCLVEIDSDAGITGLGEAKAAVGNLGNYAAIVTLIREEFAPLLIGRDPRDITGAWGLLYNGSRAHYAVREGRTFPTIGRRGVTLSAVSGIDIALWDILGRSLDVPLWRLMGGRYRDRVPAYASGGWAPVGGIGKQMLQYGQRGPRAGKMRVGRRAVGRGAKRRAWRGRSSRTTSRGSRSRCPPTTSPARPRCAPPPTSR